MFGDMVHIDHFVAFLLSIIGRFFDIAPVHIGISACQNDLSIYESARHDTSTS